MTGRLRVKICGITNQGDANTAIEAGADAIGFNLFPGSKRHVRVEDVVDWIGTLGGAASRVAVMVNPTLDELRQVQPLFDVIQLHGTETSALCAAANAGGRIWKAFPLTAELDPEEVNTYKADSIVIDTSTPRSFGGTGVMIDLDLAARFVTSGVRQPVWLSGGLRPDNVAAAVEKVRPYGVDVASGVEAPGNARRKDRARIRAFVDAARAFAG